MNKVTFLRTLRLSLRGLPETEIVDIVRDYEEHFNIGISKGKMEEEISAELGDPVELAKNYIDLDREHTVEEGSSAIRSVYRTEETEERRDWGNFRRTSTFRLNPMALLGMIFLTGLVALPVIGALIGVLGGIFAVAASLAAGSLISLVVALGVFGMPGAYVIPFAAGLSMLCAGVSGCFFYGLIFAGKWFIKGVVAYFRWCWRVSGGISYEK